MSDLPPALEAAVLKTLAKDPNERFFDFSLFLDMIRSVLSPPPAFPLLRPTSSRKNRIISHPMQAVEAEDIVSPIRKRAARRVAPELFEPSEAFSSAKGDMAEPMIAPAIPGASISGQTGTPALTESLASTPQSQLSMDADSRGNRENDSSHQQQKHKGSAATVLDAIPLSKVLTGEQAMPMLLAEQKPDDVLFTNLFADLFEEEDVDELPLRALTSSAHGQSKGITNTMTSSLVDNIVVPGLPSTQTVWTWRSRKTLMGLVILILVIGASSAYGFFSPSSPIQPDLLSQPVRVMRQGAIFPQVPLQGPDTADKQPSGKNTYTADTQSATQDKSIPTEQSPSQITSSSLNSSSSPSSGPSSSPSSGPSSSPSSGPSSSPSSSSSSSPSSGSSSSPSSSPSSSQGSTTTINMTIYFSGWTDNSPPGGSIAYPQIHSTAGGTGTYADPITYAASKNALSPGTIIYVSFLKKYFIMEDDCSACDSAWKNNHTYEVSLWTGGDANSSKSAQESCENSLTPNSLQPVDVQPPSGDTVDTTPLFTDSGGCIKL